ncbi:hypothetical protein FQN49_000094 [Arthroderma sp. PD_2]|nr:hypothetical protein FQN49_000094 [Arthroderma sp. PD_2]
MPTLLNYLTLPNPNLDRSNARPGGNSFDPSWDSIDDIEEWSDFNYNNLMNMLGHILTPSYPQHQLLMPPPLQRATLRIVDETTVTGVLLKWNHTIVDHALKLAFEAVDGNGAQMSWALGGQARPPPGEQIYPDWAGIDFSDSKVSSKWNTAMQDADGVNLRRGLSADVDDEYDEQETEFFKPLAQVVHYAKLWGTRYAYVISDKELVCIRRRISEHEGTPVAHSRGQRSTGPPATPTRSARLLAQGSAASPDVQVVIRGQQTPQGYGPLYTPHRSRASASASPSILLSSPGAVRSSPSAYTDQGNPDRNEAVEMVVIPWSENRPGRLTVNLALFWLHILAAFDIEPEASYPALDADLAKTLRLR